MDDIYKGFEEVEITADKNVFSEIFSSNISSAVVV